MMVKTGKELTGDVYNTVMKNLTKEQGSSVADKILKGLGKKKKEE